MSNFHCDLEKELAVVKDRLFNAVGQIYAQWQTIDYLNRELAQARWQPSEETETQPPVLKQSPAYPVPPVLSNSPIDSSAHDNAKTQKMLDTFAQQAKAIAAGIGGLLVAAVSDPAVLSDFQNKGWKAGLSALGMYLLVYMTKNRK